jgi:phosphoglycerate dehydrogenase-like enzyme
MHIAVLDDYQGVCDRYADWSILDGRITRTVFRDHEADPNRLADRLQSFDAIATMRERTPFPRTLLERLPRLRLLTTTGMRNRAFDLACARERGIVVCGTQSTYDSTSELTLGLILALARGLLIEHGSIAAGGWQVGVGMGLRGRILGLMGLGKIGAEVAALARLLGMRVIAWSPNLTPERAAPHHATLVDKATLFAEADVISIHMVLSPRTLRIVGREDIARMKPSAFLVNTSRGPLIDEAALVDALERAHTALPSRDPDPAYRLRHRRPLPHLL